MDISSTFIRTKLRVEIYSYTSNYKINSYKSFFFLEHIWNGSHAATSTASPSSRRTLWIIWFQSIFPDFLLSSQFLKCISEKTAKFWIEASQEELKNAIRLQKFNANVAKNVIIFLGKFLPLCVKANTMTKRSCAQFKANAVKDNTQFIEVKREKKTMVVFFASVR